jgi:hypothetical protein
VSDTRFDTPAQAAKREAEPIFGIAASIAFLLLAVVCVWLIREYGAFEPAALTFLDFALLGFACLRLIHLVTFDKILEPLRRKLQSGDRMAGLLAGFVACIWCTGMWAAMIATTLHFLVPWGRLAIWVLAVAGFGTLLQVISRAIAGNRLPRE